MLGPDMTCARKFVTQVCCSASDHYAAGHRFPTMKSAKQNRRSLVGTTAENQRANPTTLFGIGIGYSLLFRIVARRVLPGFGSPQRLLDSHFTSGYTSSQSKGPATIFQRSVPRK